MKNIIIALLTLWLVTGGIYLTMIINELESENRVYKELHKACEADRLWKQIQLQGAN